MQKIGIIAQFSLDILQIQESLWACPGMPDHTHMNDLNHIDAFSYATHKNQIHN